MPRPDHGCAEALGDMTLPDHGCAEAVGEMLHPDHGCAEALRDTPCLSVNGFRASCQQWK